MPLALDAFKKKIQIEL